jgi:hypothetical protein
MKSDIASKSQEGQGKIKPIYAAKDDRHFLIRWGEKLLAVLSTIVLWGFLSVTLYRKLFVEANESLQLVLAILLLGLVISVLLLGSWQLYNWARYRKKTRRQEFRRQTLAEEGVLYGISESNMARLQDIRKAAVVEFRQHRYYYCIDGEEAIEIGMLNR